MPNNVDSVIANEALQQTSAPPCSPRLFIYFSAPLQLATKRLAINNICEVFIKSFGHVARGAYCFAVNLDF